VAIDDSSILSSQHLTALQKVAHCVRSF
jgi:hypothetical protein